MEEFLRIMEQPSSSAELTIDAERLKVFKMKVNIWDYDKISAGDFQKLSFDDRASISAKYSVGASKMFIYLFSFSPGFFGSLISRCYCSRNIFIFFQAKFHLALKREIFCR